MWLCSSSVGRKLVMSISGLFLLLFLTFHVAMNLVAVFSADAYNMICEILGANWYAIIGTAVIAGGFVFHIGYALWLTIQNRTARGSERYEVTSTSKGVSWASQNMFVLGVIILLGLCLHGYQFWYKMQFAELMGIHDGHEFGPADGAGAIRYYFSNIEFVILYLLWFAALWFHLTHGFWSAFQTMGINNKVWYNRLKMGSTIYASLICGGFAIVVIVTYLQSLFPCC